MNIKNLLRTAATLAAAVLLALPAAAQQADFTTFVSIGDSLSGGFLDSCWVEYGQRDSYPAIIARQAGVSAFEQPLIGKPGLGSPGCMYLTSLAPTFGYRPSTGLPLNLTLARPYNNLSIPGFTIHDVVTTNPTSGASLALLTLRGKGTALLQAASLKPTFMTIYVGNNDIFSAITSATTIPCPDPAVPGCTLTSMSSINADLDTIFNTLKAAQGGTGKGVVLNLGDGPSIPFVTTVSPVLGIYPAGTPAAGQPIYALSNVGCPTGVPVCPVPPGSYLTLVAAQYLQAGYGIPCAILPPTDPRQANCNKPLPDNYSVNPTTGAVSPGVVLTPPEVAAIRLEIQQINAAIQTKATAAGYKVMDMQAWFSDIIAHGRSYGGLNATAAYLAGGIFSYDGAHLSSLGYAILANDLINFIKTNYGNNLAQADMYPFLFNGDTSAGGYPIGAALSPDEQINWAAAIFAPDTWQENLKYIFPQLSLRHAISGNPLEAPISIDRAVSGDGSDRVH